MESIVLDKEKYNKDTGEFLVTCPHCHTVLRDLSVDAYKMYSTYGIVDFNNVICHECGASFSFTI